MPRYLIVIDPSATHLAEAAEAVIKAKIKVAERLEFINTLVVSGNADKVLSLRGKVKGLVSIEEEGEVGALDS